MIPATGTIHPITCIICINQPNIIISRILSFTLLFCFIKKVWCSPCIYDTPNFLFSLSIFLLISYIKKDEKLLPALHLRLMSSAMMAATASMVTTFMSFFMVMVVMAAFCIRIISQISCHKLFYSLIRIS